MKVNKKKKFFRQSLVAALSLAIVLLVGFFLIPDKAPKKDPDPANPPGDAQDKVTVPQNSFVATDTGTIILDDDSEIKFELYGDNSPITVENFIELVNDDFYDGLIFHRVITGFMIQTGCPDGTGLGGSDETIKGEFSENDIENNLLHDRGVLSMARGTTLDSASSQFFIVHKVATHLDGKYATFGKVTEGLDVVDKIASAETIDPSNENFKPVTDIVVKTISID